MRARSLISLLVVVSAIAAIDPQADAVSRKLDAIDSGKAKAGSVFVFTAAELNAWAREKTASIVPQGFRKPRLELRNGAAVGYAVVDFLKLRNAAGVETSWLMRKLVEGEKPVQATAEIRSANGRMTVHLARVEIGGLGVSGASLDFLIHTFFLPLYPNAKIDEPFELANGIDHIEVTPAAARVYIKKK